VDQLLRVIDVLNPNDEAGRLTLIHRMGAANVARSCPHCLKRSSAKAAACCGSAIRCTATPKAPATATRRAASATSAASWSRLRSACARGTRLGGVHLELTGEDVTECLGGARELTESDLERAYRSTVDPRLNYEQALEIAMLIVRKQAQLARPE
jgi:3-deoxy-7-phosphoheptulonate synthase